MAALTGFAVMPFTARITQGKFAPREPSAGLFTSMMSAASDRDASSILHGLTSRNMEDGGTSWLIGIAVERWGVPYFPVPGGKQGCIGEESKEGPLDQVQRHDTQYLSER